MSAIFFAIKCTQMRQIQMGENAITLQNPNVAENVQKRAGKFPKITSNCEKPVRHMSLKSFVNIIYVLKMWILNGNKSRTQIRLGQEFNTKQEGIVAINRCRVL